MLGRLLKRQIQPSLVYTKSGYVDSLGRVGRAFQANWAGTYVDTNTALGVPRVWVVCKLEEEVVLPRPGLEILDSNMATVDSSQSPCDSNVILDGSPRELSEDIFPSHSPGFGLP